jgi:meso-butanediol dehydrogenase/(S,S)-butanediol dehydrogenase/diacetyl reductase
MGQLDGRRALIWGGGSGIGFGCAVALRDAGARVAIASRDPARLAAAAARLGDCPWESADATVEADVVRATGSVVTALGGLDTLVVSSGGGGPTPVGATTLEEVRRILEVNLLPVFLAVEVALPHLLAGGGAVIAISSIYGLVGQRERLAYCAAKSGVIGMVRAMALDLAERRVRVNALCPGFVETKLARAIAAKEPDPEAALAARRGMHPIPRAGTPAEIGAAAVWLASDAGAWVTGQAIPIDGGYTAR